MSEATIKLINSNFTNVTSIEHSISGIPILSNILAVVHVLKGLTGLIGSLGLACGHGMVGGYYQMCSMKKKSSMHLFMSQKALFIAKKSVGLCTIALVESIPVLGNLAVGLIVGRCHSHIKLEEVRRASSFEKGGLFHPEKPGFVIENYHQLMLNKIKKYE
ncbi:MAG: hypothetical protein QRY74_04430 [Chlamydia sp.]